MSLRSSQHGVPAQKAKVPSSSQERLGNYLIQVGMQIQQDCQNSMVARLRAKNAKLRKENARLRQQLAGSLPSRTVPYSTVANKEHRHPSFPDSSSSMSSFGSSISGFPVSPCTLRKENVRLTQQLADFVPSGTQTSQRRSGTPTSQRRSGSQTPHHEAQPPSLASDLESVSECQCVRVRPQRCSGSQAPQRPSGSQTPQRPSESQTPQRHSGSQTPQRRSGSQTHQFRRISASTRGQLFRQLYRFTQSQRRSVTQTSQQAVMKWHTLVQDTTQHLHPTLPELPL